MAVRDDTHLQMLVHVTEGFNTQKYPTVNTVCDQFVCLDFKQTVKSKQLKQSLHHEAQV